MEGTEEKNGMPYLHSHFDRFDKMASNLKATENYTDEYGFNHYPHFPSKNHLISFCPNYCVCVCTGSRERCNKNVFLACPLSSQSICLIFIAERNYDEKLQLFCCCED